MPKPDPSHEDIAMGDFTRLYRVVSSAISEPIEWIAEGQKASGAAEAAGRWFVADPAMLDWYREDIGTNTITVYVDVPTADLETYRVSNCVEQIGHRPVKFYSRDQENEFFLPRELADQGVVISDDLGAFDRLWAVFVQPDDPAPDIGRSRGRSR